jgi:hypothetical protein
MGRKNIALILATQGFLSLSVGPIQLSWDRPTGINTTKVVCKDLHVRIAGSPLSQRFDEDCLALKLHQKFVSRTDNAQLTALKGTGATSQDFAESANCATDRARRQRWNFE